MVEFTDHHDSGDISLILRHILRPSSPPPPSPVVHSQLSPGPVFSCSDRISVDRFGDDTLNGIVLSSSARFFSGSGLGSGSGEMPGLVREYIEECDCGNEENNVRRNQSKRSRAAEVHNISEKRRRSKINEKMKALQNLIPNSNKTDKASMLDEAIEYLKQLQLKVQMLSIKNGLNLHALCLPEAPEIFRSVELSQIGGDVGHKCGSLDVIRTNAPKAITTPNTLDSDGILSLPKQYVSQGAVLPGVESCVVPNFSSFEVHDQAVCRNQRPLCNLKYVSNTEMKAQDISECDFNKYKLLEEVGTQKCGTQIWEMLPGNISVSNQLTPKISGLFEATTSAPNDTKRV